MSDTLSIFLAFIRLDFCSREIRENNAPERKDKRENVPLKEEQQDIWIRFLYMVERDFIWKDVSWD